MAGSQIGGAAATAMGATPYGAAAGAVMGAIGGDSAPATSAATSGDASQAVRFNAAFGNTFGDFNFAPANGDASRASAASAGINLPLILGFLSVGLTLGYFLTRKG